MLHIMTPYFFFTCFHFSSYHFYLGPHNFTHGLFQQTPSCSPSIQFHANPFFIVLTKLIFLKHCFITSLFSSRMMWFPVSYWIEHKALHFSPLNPALISLMCLYGPLTQPCNLVALQTMCSLPSGPSTLSFCLLSSSPHLSNMSYFLLKEQSYIHLF